MTKKIVDYALIALEDSAKERKLQMVTLSSQGYELLGAPFVVTLAEYDNPVLMQAMVKYEENS